MTERPWPHSAAGPPMTMPKWAAVSVCRMTATDARIEAKTLTVAAGHRMARQSMAAARVMPEMTR